MQGQPRGIRDGGRTTTPVLVVGGGPVGLALAGELGWRGIGCVLIERGDGAIDQPRMDLVGIRTMEFCRRWGIVEWVRNAGYNRDYPQDCVWVTALTGYELGRENLPAPRRERPPPQSPQTRERCPQDFFDPVLARFARSFPHVTLRYRAELTGFEEHANGVAATVTDRASGRQETIEASYLVGCDGGTSTVRERLGIGMSGTPVLTYTTNAIFRCDGLEKLHDKAPGYRFIFIGPEGTWATLVAINGRERWRFSLVGDANRRTLSAHEVRSAIVRAVGRDFEFEILSILPWVRRQLVADGYGSRRVFIAGDAAHLTSPTGGFGMNTGIQDAVDLGWKLDACVRGWGGPALLESYEAERRPVAIRNVNEATGNLNRMLSPRERRPPSEIFDPGAAGDSARAQFGAAFTETMRREWFSIGIHLGYRYDDSPVVVADGTPAPPDEVTSYTQTSRPGARAPHAWLAEGRSTLDLFGRGFVLLRLGANPPPADALGAAARRCDVPLAVTDVADAAVARLYERRLALVRPDGHTAWRGDTLPEDCRQLIDTVRGAASDNEMTRRADRWGT
ncbi:MAG TPA: FAD-dependent oxidoreductase [Burkholderiales bacterium]|nr:FAD-dependent oxidoreductase [Burkholderiales bacterium]